MLEHSFTGTPFTVGIEEELMLDAETLDLAQGIETILGDVLDGLRRAGQARAHSVGPRGRDRPCRDIAERRPSCATCARWCARSPSRHGIAVGAAGTHPFAAREEQQIVERARYQELVGELGWIAGQELIFGTHVHVGIDGPDKAIYVADGIRRHLPLLLALSPNSPLWRGRGHRDDVGLRTRSSAPSRASASPPTTGAGRSTPAGSS